MAAHVVDFVRRHRAAPAGRTGSICCAACAARGGSDADHAADATEAAHLPGVASAPREAVGMTDEPHGEGALVIGLFACLVSLAGMLVYVYVKGF